MALGAGRADAMMLSAPLPVAMALYLRWEARDPTALAEVGEMFPAGSECFCCGSAVGDKPGLLSTEDPAAKRKNAILAPLCPTCMALPKLYRMAKIRRMLRAMFGDKVGHPQMLKPDEVRKIAAQR
jgi:hypothetical protein